VVACTVHRMFRHRNLMRLTDACVMPSPTRSDATEVYLLFPLYEVQRSNGLWQPSPRVGA
jgi:hypothetical protein